MTTLMHSTTINAPAEAVFAFLRDPARLAGAYPDPSTELLGAPEPPAVVGTTFTWRFRVLGLHQEATLEYTEVEPDQSISIRSSKGFVYTGSIEPAGAATKLSIGVHDLPANVAESAIGAVAMKLTEGDLDRWLANIKSELETGVPIRVHAGRHRAVKRTVTVGAPVEQVFEFLADPANAFGTFPDTWVTDVHREPQGVGTSCRWHARLLGMPMAVTHEYTEVVPNERIVSNSSIGFVVTWTLEPADGSTRLTMEEDVAASNWVAAALESVVLRWSERDIEDWLAAIAGAVGLAVE
ncbi:MAG: SRPBCC family protein [Candidatus Nanopelagicales bacterium]